MPSVIPPYLLQLYALGMTNAQIVRSISDDIVDDRVKHVYASVWRKFPTDADAIQTVRDILGTLMAPYPPLPASVDWPLAGGTLTGTVWLATVNYSSGDQLIDSSNNVYAGSSKMWDASGDIHLRSHVVHDNSDSVGTSRQVLNNGGSGSANWDWLYYANSQQMTDASSNLYYPGGGLFVDNSNTIHYPDSTQMVPTGHQIRFYWDSGSQAWDGSQFNYSDGTTFLTSTAKQVRFYWDNGTQAWDGSKMYYGSGQQFIESSNNLYLQNGGLFYDATGSSGSPGQVLTINGSGQP